MPRQKTKSNRPIWRSPRKGPGGEYSEFTVTFPMGGLWYTFPSVGEIGDIMPEEQVRSYVARYGPIDPITGEKFPVFDTQDAAVDYAKKRSSTRTSS